MPISQTSIAAATLTENLRQEATQKGFTLVELMITVSVVAILASVAYPGYQEYVVRSNRSEMQQVMLDIANREEEYLLNNRQYTASLSDLNIALPSRLQPLYSINITTTASPPGFTLTATPVSGKAQAGDGVLGYNSNGTKTPSGKW